MPTQSIRCCTGDNNGQVGATRGILHGAMALYLTRYLNVPPARIPGEHDEQLDDLPGDVEAIRSTCSTLSIGSDRSISLQG
jgi:hypothetical protein